MSAGVMITLIICVTIILLFGTVMIAATVLSKNKQPKPPTEYRSANKRMNREDK